MSFPGAGPHPVADILLDQVTFTHADSTRPVLRDATVHVEQGDLALVVGRTGSGKSTLLGAIAGSVPHFTGGHLRGRVVVAGRHTRDHRPRDLADVVGVVGQDPLAGFVTDTVEEELAYAMEQLGLPGAVMRKRVEETLDLLGIAELRAAPLRDLSGGQQQRVAIGSVLTAHPQIIVLDEPTSALDPTGAEEVLATITRLVHDLGVTVVLAEHRIERVVQFADTVIEVRPDGTVRQGAPGPLLTDASVAPPIIELGRWAGWVPLPLSIRDARRQAGPLRAALADSPAVTSDPTNDVRNGGDDSIAVRASGVVVRHGSVVAVAGVDLSVRAGEVTALMGRNGAGKSSLLWALQGSGTLTKGRVRLDDGATPSDLSPQERRRRIGLVPQSAGDLLYLDSVGAECRQADTESAAEPGTCAALLATFAPGVDADTHPRDLSEGQRLALVLAVQLTADPAVLLLDEPTRGLDYPAKAALTRTLRRLADAGRCVIVSTHDVEFVAGVADRVVVMAGGEVVADGPTAEVVVASPAFAPQVAKITAPGPWLTVAQIRAALPDGVAQ